MLRLFISLAFLGLSAIDPIRIAIMPVLLTQNKPYKRSAIFLSGSFSALMLMGLLFSKGIGAIVLRFEHSHAWFVPTIERSAGVLLLVIAVVTFIRYKSGKSETELPDRTLKSLKLSSVRLFLLGSLIVAVQSVVDVVFVIAMVRTGQYKLADPALVAAIATYAITALLIQIAVVCAFRLTPKKERNKLLAHVQKLLTNYSSQALIIISLALGVLLLVIAG